MHIFLSYAKKDSRPLALELRDQLRVIPTVTVWMDEAIEVGSDWDLQIQDELDRCDLFIVLLSEDVNRRTTPRSFVIREIQHAQDQKKLIIPVLAGKTSVPLILKGMQYIDLTRNKTAGMSRLLAEVRERAGYQFASTMPLQPVTLPGAARRSLGSTCGIGLLIGGVISATLIGLVLVAMQILDSGDDKKERGATTPTSEQASALPTPTTVVNDCTYVVQDSDSVSGIAESLGVTVQEIAEANNLSNPNLLFPSQRLIIPNCTPQTSSSSKIAFASDRDGNYEIYMMDADGSNQRNLTHSEGWDSAPAWSPDGSQLAFYSIRDGSFQIYVMNPEGSQLRSLTSGSGDNYFPVWSPDGSRLAFYSTRDGNADIYVMDANGANQRNLTNHVAEEWDPSWSPDGSRIAFSSTRDGNHEIYVMDAEGGNLQNLTNNPTEDFHPAWSPDGSRLAFYSDRNGNNEIYVMDAEAGNPQNLTNDSANDYIPAWSPDGSRIAFSSTRNGNGEVYVMGADGSNPQNLSNSLTNDELPAWQP